MSSPSRPSTSAASTMVPTSPGFHVPVFSQQGAASSQDLDDQRFSELLRPIKDLTVNWEVPLARYLEDYISELGELGELGRVAPGHKVNFVEAALLLQGTASVYSKKVEFLWQNTLKMLDMLASQKALEEAAAGSGGADGAKSRKRRGAHHDFNDFTRVSCEMTKAVNMKGDSIGGAAGSAPLTASARDKKVAALNFISVTPRQLIEKEGREQKAVRVNLYSRVQGGHKDLIGHKEDFRVNAQFSLTTVTVGEELNEECDLSQHSVSLYEDSLSFMETSLLQPAAATATAAAAAAVLSASSGGGPAAANSSPSAVLAASTSQDPGADRSPLRRQQSSEDGGGEGDDQPPSHHDEGSLDLGPGGVDDDDNFLAPAPPSPEKTAVGEPQAVPPPDAASPLPTVTDQSKTEEPRRSGRTRRNKLQESLEEPRAPLVGPWEPIKPEDSTAPPKPIKKGKTCKAPKGTPPTNEQNQQQNQSKYKTTAAERRRKFQEKHGIVDSADRVKVTVPIEQYLIREHTNLGRCQRVEPEFRDKAAEEENLRKQTMTETERQREKERVQREEDEEPDREETDKSPEAAGVPDVAGSGGDADQDGGWEEFQGGADDFDPGGTDQEEDAARTANDAELLRAMAPDGALLEEGGQGGEKEKGANGNGGDSYEELVMKRVAEYVQQSHEYIESTDLAKRVSRWHSGIRPRLDAVEKRGNFDIHRYGSDILGSFPDGDRGRKTTVPFTECVKGKDREEVCRYFLSALMLANTYNIELGTAGEGEAGALPEDGEDIVNSSVASAASEAGSKLARKKKGKRRGVSSFATGKSGRTADSLPMDGVEMTLLSTVRHHEEMLAYAAPAEGSAAATNGGGPSLLDGDSSSEEDEDDFVLLDKRKRKAPPLKKRQKASASAKGKAGKGAKVKNNRKRKLNALEEEEDDGEAEVVRENGVAAEGES